MPLFDFDYEWSWDEFVEAVPTAVPFVGKWVGRSRGEWNPLAQYWNLSEEDLLAHFTVNVIGSASFGTAGWLAINFYEDYRALRLLASGRWFLPATTIGTAYATHHVVETSTENIFSGKPGWLGIVPIPIAGLLGWV